MRSVLPDNAPGENGARRTNSIETGTACAAANGNQPSACFVRFRWIEELNRKGVPRDVFLFNGGNSWRAIVNGSAVNAGKSVPADQEKFFEHLQSVA